MSHQQSPLGELVFTTRNAQYRHWMKNTTFVMKGVTYRILSGGWIGRKDSVLFEDVKTGKRFDMAEEEFFSKVDKTKLKNL